jgi:hypothetical protein
MKPLTTSILSALLLLGFAAYASPASDNTGNYAVWTNTSNGGTGFGDWDLTNNNNDNSTLFSGYFLGDSTSGAGNVNVSGNAFGIYANPGAAFATAQRDFASAMSVGETFSVELGLNFDNGNKGLNLRDASNNQIFNFNVGSGAQIGTAFTNNPITATYDYGGAAVIDVALTLDSSTQLSYLVTRTSPQGTQGTLFSGTITGLSAAPGNVEFYNSGTDNGDAQNNLYFNNLAIIPEPETAMMLLIGIGLIAYLRRRN